jgi:hypothetical protein
MVFGKVGVFGVFIKFNAGTAAIDAQCIKPRGGWLKFLPNPLGGLILGFIEFLLTSFSNISFIWGLKTPSLLPPPLWRWPRYVLFPFLLTNKKIGTVYPLSPHPTRNVCVYD